MKINKAKYIFIFLIGFLLILSFFFKIIPIPVENIQGAENPDKFIYGGIYWTSILYQLEVENYSAVALCFILFIILGGVILLI